MKLWLLLGFGEANATFYSAVDWQAAEIEALVFLPPGREPGPATRRRLEAHNARAVNDTTIVAGAEVILAAVTPQTALAAAQSVVPYLTTGTFYVDMNSIAGVTAQEIATLVMDAGGCFVDAAIMGPVPLQQTQVPIMLAGPEATDFHEFAGKVGFNTAVISQRPGDASSLKLLWSVMTKGTIGLLAESLVAAQRLGLLPAMQQLIAEWYGPTGTEQMVLRMLGSTTRSGVRRLDEMRATRLTLDNVIVPTHMVDATIAWIDTLSKISVPENESVTVESIVSEISRQME